jgi:hypothetical protein
VAFTDVLNKNVTGLDWLDKRRMGVDSRRRQEKGELPPIISRFIAGYVALQEFPGGAVKQY